MKAFIYSFLVMLISSALLAAMPSAAYNDTLEIFGNANMDDMIDEQDVEYVRGILDGTNEETKLADANYDGEIDEEDIAQIELIINGEEKELTLVQYLKYPVAYSEEPVTISMPIETIVALGGTYGPYALCALGEADKIVAVTEGAKDRGETRDLLEDKPEIGSTKVWDMEMILELDPDIVLAYACYDYSDYRKTLDTASIPLVQMDFHVPEKYFKEISTLGWILNKQERAEDLINFEEEHLGTIEERVKDLSDEQKPRVYAEGYNDNQASSSTGSSTGRAVGPCGGINIFDEIENSADIESEAVIVRNPQVILKMVCQYSGAGSGHGIPSGYGATDTSRMEELRNDIMNRPGFDKIDAVDNGRVFIITSDAASVHPSIFSSYVAKWLHPELFEDMDPVAIHEEWLQKFLGIEYDGIYAYPLL